MRYFIRTIKYFVYIVIIITLLILILMFTNFIEKDVSKVFVRGYDSIWQMALIIAALSAFYPRFGYTARVAHLYADPSQARPIIDKTMDMRNYKLSKIEEDTLFYIKRYPFDRAVKMWEDTITIRPVAGGWEVEGLTREVARLVSNMEAQLRDNY